MTREQVEILEVPVDLIQLANGGWRYRVPGVLAEWSLTYPTRDAAIAEATDGLEWDASHTDQTLADKRRRTLERMAAQAIAGLMSDPKYQRFVKAMGL